MCTNFIPASRPDFRSALDLPEPAFDYPQETYVSYRVPIVIVAPDTEAMELREAQFGLVPFWSKDTKISRHTYNARSETVAVKPELPRSLEEAPLCAGTHAWLLRAGLCDRQSHPLAHRTPGPGRVYRGRHLGLLAKS